MSITSVFSNHAGTMSPSFAIGKGGVKLLQGVGEPTGITAPTGSLYLLKGSPNRVYQIDSTGAWSPLLSPSSIAAGTGTNVSYANGVVSVSAQTTKYKTTFTSDDLTSGQLTVDHGLNEDFPQVVVYNDSKQLVIPSSVTSVDANSVVIDVSSYTVNSNWTVTVISGF
jgi:hypothetical protein